MKPILFFIAVAAALAAPPDPDRGLYAIWGRDSKLLELPFIHGGQVNSQWKIIEPAPGHYDFTSLDQQFAALHGRPATVQINANEHPDFLFTRVPHTAKTLSVQTRDPQGTLAYWHPAYVQSHLALLHAYAQHLKQASYRSHVLGVRLNFNALGTEHTAVPAEYRDPARWTAPPGVDPAPKWTQEVSEVYRRLIVEAFIREFTPEIRVFVRNNFFSGGDADPTWLKMLETGRLALFHTSSEIEPRPRGEGQYRVFLDYCRAGHTVCYAESWADATGRHGGQTDPRWCPPGQYNYWRLLGDLNWGVTFIAIYAADLAHWQEPEYRAAFDFAALYAGFHASPSQSPGAWLALREGHQLKGDYSFLMQHLPGDEMPAIEKVGPDDQRFGAWARILKKGSQAKFKLDPEFAKSLQAKVAAVNVTYLDRGQGMLTLNCTGRLANQPLRDSGRWKTATLHLENMSFGEGADITLSADIDVILHMVEVRR